MIQLLAMLIVMFFSYRKLLEMRQAEDMKAAKVEKQRE